MPPKANAKYGHEKDQANEDYFGDWNNGKFCVRQSESECYIAINMEIVGDADCGGSFTSLASIESEKQQLKKFLEPLGLWDESGFGIYVWLS